jgi:hypothetical protein
MERFQQKFYENVYGEFWLSNPQMIAKIKSDLAKEIQELSGEDAFYFLELIKLTTRGDEMSN